MKETVKHGVPVVIYSSIIHMPFLLAFAFIADMVLLATALFVFPLMEFLLTHLLLSFIVLCVVPVTIYLVGVVKRRRRYNAFFKRFKNQHGMICFACGYDLYEGQRICSECGSAWAPEKLNDKWKSMLKTTVN